VAFDRFGTDRTSTNNEMFVFGAHERITTTILFLDGYRGRCADSRPSFWAGYDKYARRPDTDKRFGVIAQRVVGSPRNH
jgi:hypothetical protein